MDNLRIYRESKKRSGNKRAGSPGPNGRKQTDSKDAEYFAKIQPQKTYYVTRTFTRTARNESKALTKKTIDISEKDDFCDVVKIFRSRIHNLKVDEIVSMLVSVNLKVAEEMISIFVSTYLNKVCFDNLIHKMTAIILDEYLQDPSAVRILIPLLNRTPGAVTDSILILLLSAAGFESKSRNVVLKVLASVGLRDPQGIVTSFTSKCQNKKRKHAEKLKIKLRLWFNAWKAHFDANIRSVISRLSHEKRVTFKMNQFVIRMIESVAKKKKHLKDSPQLLYIDFNTLPSNLLILEGYKEFIAGRLTSDYLTNVVVALLNEILENKHLEIKPIDVLNYFVDIVGNRRNKLLQSDSVPMDPFDKYAAHPYQIPGNSHVNAK